MLRSGCEVEPVPYPSQVAIAKGQRPKPVYFQRIVLAVLKLAEERARVRVKGADAPVAEIADEQGAVQSAPKRRSDQGQTPGRIESAVRCEPLRSEEHTSELQSPCNLVCRLLLEKKKRTQVSEYGKLT